MITAATVEHAHILSATAAKALVRDTLRSLVSQFKVTLKAWVILDNHYHLLLRTSLGSDLPRFVRRLHGSTSRSINEMDNRPGRQVWHNYWDACVRTETGLWSRFNYIHHNPIKHGYVQKTEDWPFSSYHYYLRTKGQQWLHDCWLQYPVIDYLDKDDFGRPAS